ncbi:Hypothetical predicted protein [Drosophila guanche]|uniref:Uncharacterized protein n=1 Tax=Drosophila guanche TaxID=7266 RepID=A0A3B0KDE3_DROGU|nr:Hypothetical predicted protein [Drosophila guanche]
MGTNLIPSWIEGQEESEDLPNEVDDENAVAAVQEGGNAEVAVQEELNVEVMVQGEANAVVDEEQPLVSENQEGQNMGLAQNQVEEQQPVGANPTTVVTLNCDFDEIEWEEAECETCKHMRIVKQNRNNNGGGPPEPQI